MRQFRTYQLAKSFYQASRSLRLSGAMKDQFDRASLSVLLNLAEGSAKPSVKERKRFYFIAFGSLRETQCILDIVGDTQLIEQADILAASMYRLCHS